LFLKLNSQFFSTEFCFEEAWQRGRNCVAVVTVKPAIATLDPDVISVPKAKKKQKKKK
jgi:hypothetical protein